MHLPPETFRALARQSSGCWHAGASHALQGEGVLETANTYYRFVDGVFQGRAGKLANGASGPLHLPGELGGAVLLGFLAYARGLWSLSMRQQPEAVGVLWHPSRQGDEAYVVTTAVLSWRLTPLAPPLSVPPARTPRPYPVLR